jgi:hypothetical protein
MDLKPFNPTSESNNETTANNDRFEKAEAKESTHGRTEEKESIPSNQTSAKEGNAAMPVNTASTNNFNAPGNVIILPHMVQGTNEWKEARRGRITMSHAKDLITKPRKKGEVSQTRLSYLISIASEIITGVTAETFKSWKMERGNILEPFARDAYAAHTGLEVMEVGLGYLNKDRRISGSPDGLGDNHGMEIKCQDPKKHLATILNGFEPKEFGPQIQGSMWIFEKEYWDYASFCPEFPEQPIFIHRVYRDDEMIKRIEDSALQGVYEIDEFVKRGRFSTTNKEIAKICEEALETIEALSYDEPEIV